MEEGAYINIVVKYGLIKLISQKADLCEQMKNVDEKCPLKGEKIITKDVDLPSRIPPVSKILASSRATDFGAVLQRLIGLLAV